MNIDRFDDTYLHGMVTASKGRTLLFTSIPYDKGWKVKVKR